MKNKPESDNLVRLNKYIANAGVCSRRQADELIRKGEISVNGTVVKEVGTRVRPSDNVSYRGKVLRSESLRYVLLNKPRDFITTTKDERNRKTVMNLVRTACRERIYPVGRLDRQSTGLLLLTNDGQLADKLLHPSNQIEKVYKVRVDRSVKEEDMNSMVNGTELEDGVTVIDSMALLNDERTEAGVEIHSGKNRIIRRIFEHYGYKVVALDRTIFAGLTKKDLPRGKWRHLSSSEVRRLRHYL